jgi:hypothetical protein
MSTKHWRIGKTYKRENSVHVYVETDEALPLTVAHVVGSTTPMLHTMAGASSLQERAHLIAAAPLLLAALQSARCCVKDGSAVAERIDAAIARATGAAHHE